MGKRSATVAEFHRFFSQCNLNMHIRHYNEHKRLVSNQVAAINQELEGKTLDPERRRALEGDKHAYLNSYHQHMIINCFLTMYSHFEKCLGETCMLFSKKMPEGRRSGLERFTDHFVAEHDVKLSDGPHWSFVCDCSKARDVLLHAGGSIALARDKKKVEALIKRNPRFLSTENSRMIPKVQLIVKVSTAIPVFIDWLTDQVN